MLLKIEVQPPVPSDKILHMVENDKAQVIRYPDFAIRVQQFAEPAGVDTAAIRKHLNVTPEMARRYWLGISKPEDEKMRLLAELLNTTPAELDWGEYPKGGATPTRFDINEPLTGYHMLRWYEDVRLSAGHGTHNTGHKAPELVPIPKWMLPADIDPADIVVVQVKGDSMRGKLDDGDYAFVNTRDKKFRDGKVYAYNHGDSTKVKYFHTRIGGGLLIRSEYREKYPDEVVAPYDMDAMDIVGRVLNGWFSL